MASRSLFRPMTSTTAAGARRTGGAATPAASMCAAVAASRAETASSWTRRASMYGVLHFEVLEGGAAHHGDGLVEEVGSLGRSALRGPGQCEHLLEQGDVHGNDLGAQPVAA